MSRVICSSLNTYLLPVRWLYLGIFCLQWLTSPCLCLVAACVPCYFINSLCLPCVHTAATARDLIYYAQLLQQCIHPGYVCGVKVHPLSSAIPFLECPLWSASLQNITSWSELTLAATSVNTLVPPKIVDCRYVLILEVASITLAVRGGVHSGRVVCHPLPLYSGSM